MSVVSRSTCTAANSNPPCLPIDQRIQSILMKVGQFRTRTYFQSLPFKSTYDTYAPGLPRFLEKAETQKFNSQIILQNSNLAPCLPQVSTQVSTFRIHRQSSILAANYSQYTLRSPPYLPQHYQQPANQKTITKNKRKKKNNKNNRNIKRKRKYPIVQITLTERITLC